MGKQRKTKIPGSLAKNLISQPPSPIVTTSARGFTSPIVSLVPREVRRQARSGSFHVREPTCPRISCLGQIKYKQNKQNVMTKPQETALLFCPKPIIKMFNDKQQRKGRFDDFHRDKQYTAVKVVPSLGQLKRFPRHVVAYKTLTGRLRLRWMKRHETENFADDEDGENVVIASASRSSRWGHGGRAKKAYAGTANS